MWFIKTAQPYRQKALRQSVHAVLLVWFFIASYIDGKIWLVVWQLQLNLVFGYCTLWWLFPTNWSVLRAVFLIDQHAPRKLYHQIGIDQWMPVGYHAVFFFFNSFNSFFFFLLFTCFCLKRCKSPAMLYSWIGAMVDTCTCDFAFKLWTRPERELLPVLPCINQSFGNTDICFPGLPKCTKLDYPIEAQTQPDVTRSVPQGSMHLPLQVQQLPTLRVLYFAWWLKAPAAAWTLRSSAESILISSSHSDQKFEGRCGSVKLHCHAEAWVDRTSAVNLFSACCCMALCWGRCPCDVANSIWLLQTMCFNIFPKG